MADTDQQMRELLARATDQVMVSNLICRNVVGVERWDRRKVQSLLISFTLWTDVSRTGNTDNLTHSHNYGVCASLVSEYAEQAHFRTAEAVACGVAHLLIAGCGVAKCTVRVVKPASLLYAQGAGVEVTRTCLDYPEGYREYLQNGPKLTKGSTSFDFPPESTVLPHPEDKIVIKDLLVRCIIGVNPWEREQKQSVVMNLVFYSDCGAAGATDKLESSIDYRAVCRRVVAAAESSDFKTLEAFVTSIAKLCVIDCGVPRVTVRAEKPSALVFADCSGVEITRSADDFNQ